MADFIGLYNPEFLIEGYETVLVINFHMVIVTYTAQFVVTTQLRSCWSEICRNRTDVHFAFAGIQVEKSDLICTLLFVQRLWYL